jgi:hypothetical protein
VNAIQVYAAGPRKAPQPYAALVLRGEYEETADWFGHYRVVKVTDIAKFERKALLRPSTLADAMLDEAMGSPTKPADIPRWMVNMVRLLLEDAAAGRRTQLAMLAAASPVSLQHASRAFNLSRLSEARAKRSRPRQALVIGESSSGPRLRLGHDVAPLNKHPEFMRFTTVSADDASTVINIPTAERGVVQSEVRFAKPKQPGINPYSSAYGMAVACNWRIRCVESREKRRTC